MLTVEESLWVVCLDVGRVNLRTCLGEGLESGAERAHSKTWRSFESAIVGIAAFLEGTVALKGLGAPAFPK
jgi:hypothetical protein